MFSPEQSRRRQFSDIDGGQVGDPAAAGFLLNINTVGGITNAGLDRCLLGARGVDEGHRGHPQLAAGSHSIQAGGSWTRTDVWLQNQAGQYVPTMNFGIDGADPANGMFTTANFSGASAAQLTEARDLFATLTGRVNSINGEQRLDENTDEYVFLGPACSAHDSWTTDSSSPTPGA